jgi:formylaminopyrimidine deformylase
VKKMMAISEGLSQKIGNEVEARKEELIDLLTKLIAFPTVSPPARNTNNVQEFIKGYLEELGLRQRSGMYIQRTPTW